MSQEQPRRPVVEQGDAAITYGDVFPVTGNLADKPIAPRDASAMQAAESTAFGQTLKGGAAAVMESAASRNEQRGVVDHSQFGGIPHERGVTVTQAEIPGKPGQRLVTEFVAGQAVRQHVVDMASGVGPVGAPGGRSDRGGVGNRGEWSDKITIGEALEATAKTAGNQPIQPSDAAAIQAAESMATGFSGVVPGGVASAAQAAVIANTWADQEEDKTKLRDVLEDAMVRIPADKEVTRVDAERVMGAEMRNNPNLDTRPGGVAATVAAAARLNEPRR